MFVGCPRYMKKPTGADFEIKVLEAKGPRQAEAIKWICISQNFNDRRARAAHFSVANISVATIRLADAVLYREAPRTNASVAVAAGRLVAVGYPAIISIVIVVVPLAIPITIVRAGTPRVIVAAVPLRRRDACRSHKGRD